VTSWQRRSARYRNSDRFSSSFLFNRDRTYGLSSIPHGEVHQFSSCGVQPVGTGEAKGFFQFYPLCVKSARADRADRFLIRDYLEPGCRGAKNSIKKGSGNSPKPITILSGRRGSNPRPTAWEAVALPTELLPRMWSANVRVAPFLAKIFISRARDARRTAGLNILGLTNCPSGGQANRFPILLWSAVCC
jgi:hypothetical protein